MGGYVLKTAFKLIFIFLPVIFILAGCSSTEGKQIHNANQKDVDEVDRKQVEAKVKAYFEQYHLDPNLIKFVAIGEPKKYPNGDYELLITVEYHGTPYFTLVLQADGETYTLIDPKEQIISAIFNRLYMEERYEDFKDLIVYLEKIEVEDTTTPEEEKLKYISTGLGYDEEINKEIREVFQEFNGDLEKFRQYIRDNRERFDLLATSFSITGTKLDLTEDEIETIKEKIYKLPAGKYGVSIGRHKDFSGVFDIFTVN